MPQDTSTFTLDFDVDELGYDPLADTPDDEDIDDFPAASPGVQMASDTDVADAAALHVAAAPLAESRKNKPVRVDTRPAKERIESLFKEMAQRRRILLGLMNYVREQRSAESLVDEVERLQRYDASVYTSANFAVMLERAGAIKKLNADGTDFDPDIEQEPDIVEIDGVEYLKPTDGRRIYWILTPEGLEFLDADRPIDRLNALFDRETVYLPIYKRVLLMCCDEGGHTMPEISKRVDKDPLVQDPRYYGNNFINKLEKCDAVVWEDCWKTTSVGREGLERLADVVDDNPMGLAKKAGE